MKVSLLLTVVCLFCTVLPAIAQNQAHETVIDGRWEAKLTPKDGPIALFEFKNETGNVSGTMTQDGRPIEIKNGSLEGNKLRFETTQVPSGGGEPVTMSWTGIIVGQGESIKLTCARIVAGSQSNGREQQMEARRVK